MKLNRILLTVLIVLLADTVVGLRFRTKSNITTDTWCETGTIKKDLCCPKECDSCGECLKNTTDYNRAINTQCCGTYIRDHYPICNYTLPPCVIFANGTYIKTDKDIFNEQWFQILLGVLAGLALLLIMVCVFYPKERAPELNYADIVNKFD